MARLREADRSPLLPVVAAISRKDSSSSTRNCTTRCCSGGSCSSIGLALVVALVSCEGPATAARSIHRPRSQVGLRRFGCPAGMTSWTVYGDGTSFVTRHIPAASPVDPKTGTWRCHYPLSSWELSMIRRILRLAILTFGLSNGAGVLAATGGDCGCAGCACEHCQCGDCQHTASARIAPNPMPWPPRHPNEVASGRALSSRER
jgi:hypothetical protein